MTHPFRTNRRTVLGGLAVGLALPGTLLRAQSQTTQETTMSGPVLYALYPQPTDAARFEADYQAHIALFHEKTGIPVEAAPNTVTKFAPGPEGPAPFYQMFAMPFPSAEALEQALADPGFQEVAADAVRISSGGAPLILVGAAA